jgi:MFS family permease
MTVAPTQPNEPIHEAAPASPDSLWHHPDFLKFWFGEGLSLFGTQITNLALPLTAVLIFNATPQQVGLLRFLQLVPYLGLALVFGVWVDRVRRKPIMMVANLGRMVLIALIPLLAHYHHLNIVSLLVLACAIGIFSVLFDVSWMSFVPALVRDPKHYVEANQKMGTTYSTAEVAGPGVAGLLISALTATTALLFDAASYLISLLTLIWIRTPEPAPKPAGEPRHLGRELVEGLRFVFGHKILRPLALIAPFCNFSLIIVWTMFLLYGVRDKGMSAAEIGLVFSASSVGGLVGATVSKAVIKRFPIGPIYAVSMSAIFVGPLLIPLAGGPRALTIALFVASFFVSYTGLGIANVVMISLRQTCTPQPLMGRMNAAFRTVLFGGGSLGGLVGGFVAAGLGLRTGLTIVAVLSSLMVIPLALLSVSRLQKLPEPPTVPAVS